MVSDRRVTFIQKWLRRAQEAEDEFDRFFAAWIALVVAAQRVRDWSGRRMEEDSDRQRILDYLLAKKSVILRVIQIHTDQMKALARRRGTRWGDPIVDTGNQNLRALFERLADYCLAGTPMDDDERVRAVGQLLNRVRNNVFHGIKVYDDRRDLELLRLVNPLLLGVLESEREAL
jgi:hypothetical protein